MFDLSSVTPQARPILRAAAHVYYQHTQPWFIGLIAHGSAVKGGFIPGCSDIDIQLYLEDTAFTATRQLPLSLCLDIHRDLANIDPAPFRYIQCNALPHMLPEGYVGPIPGAYTIVAGSLPIPEATSPQLRQSAHTALAKFNPLPAYITRGLLEHGGGRLQLNVRWLCTDVWPTLYNILSLQQADPIHVWGLPKDQAIQLLPQNTAIGQTIRDFYQAVLAYYPAEAPIEQALKVIESGLAFLREAASWVSTT